MKDFETHYKDILREHRNGDHTIEWKEGPPVGTQEFALQGTKHIKVFGVSKYGEFWFWNFWKGSSGTKNIYFYDETKLNTGSNIGSWVSYKKGRMFCQKWYLKWLTEKRSKEI